MKHNQGFTLAELMITVAILAILASIAYGSYTRYIVRSAEAQVEARMQSLSMEMERYRSSRLTYKGFVPRKVTDSGNVYEYDDGQSTVHSNTTQNRYIISITDTGGRPLGDDDANGGQWVMFAVPNEGAMSEIKHRYFMSSTGQKCRSVNSDFSSATNCTGAGVESW